MVGMRREKEKKERIKKVVRMDRTRRGVDCRTFSDILISCRMWAEFEGLPYSPDIKRAGGGGGVRVGFL